MQLNNFFHNLVTGPQASSTTGEVIFRKKNGKYNKNDKVNMAFSEFENGMSKPDTSFLCKASLILLFL